MLKMVERMKWRRRGSIVAMLCSCDRRGMVGWESRCCLTYISMYGFHVGDNGQATSQLEAFNSSCAMQTKTPTRGTGVAQDVAAAADEAKSKMPDEAIVSE
jgi:hypothetical protein